MKGITDNAIRERVIVAFFSIEELSKRLALKGGNAVTLAYKIEARASVDLDFSLIGALSDAETRGLVTKIERKLQDEFRQLRLHVFDLRFAEEPARLSPANKAFWGGYSIEFKIIEIEKAQAYAEDLAKLQRNALTIGVSGKVTVDLSKHEYCVDVITKTVGGVDVVVYTPRALVFEKLRAICQQMPEYCEFVSRSPRPRASDFYDIELLCREYQLRPFHASDLPFLVEVFRAKRVPLELLSQIRDHSDAHRADFDRVEQTVSPSMDLHDFDYYLDYCCEAATELQALRKE